MKTNALLDKYKVLLVITSRPAGAWREWVSLRNTWSGVIRFKSFINHKSFGEKTTWPHSRPASDGKANNTGASRKPNTEDS